MPSHPPAEITLVLSASAGIVAVAHGERYRWAQTALQRVGFQRRDNGTSALAVNDPQAARDTVHQLIRTARRHQATVTASSRRYLGDIADEMAAHLPGQWSARVGVHSHPVWQHDLVPWLWDAGELIRAVQTERLPYTAVLTDGTGIELLLVERPGHQSDYLLGAFAPNGFDEHVAKTSPPGSIVLPAAPEQAARAIADRFLPAYHHALHARRWATVAFALERIREEYDTRQAVKESGRFSDASPLDPGHIPDLEGQFADFAWQEFRNVLTHAPALLDQCRPATTGRPEDAAALQRLRDALVRGTGILAGWNARLEDLRETPEVLPAATYGEAKAERDARVLPVIEAWLADGEVFLRHQARAAAPPHPLAVRDHGVLPLPPALPTPPGASPARR
ncbi:hypothetical protein [Streptomyces ureilyticus]|uniref:hypothetical protein n=1 Tax=Streptomyces ureilyticus TaxID=1775131 RepID=UPI0019D08996|nr:hypothetical protein [Streptomyces ureilyticus]